MTGRPLRFLLLVTTGWVGARAIMLWPGDPIAKTAQAIVPQAAAAEMSLSPPEPARPTSPPDQAWIAAIRPGALVSHPAGATTAPGIWPIQPPTLTSPHNAPAIGIVAGLPRPVPPSTAKSRSRFFGSFWLLARGGSGPPGGVPGVQLGGSQAGVRLGYALHEDRRVALVARVSAPLGRGMREAALGVEWQPTRLPVRIVAEHRFALGAGRGGPTLAAVGGIGPVALAGGFRLEAYAQGGVIGRDGAEGFADGAVRVARPVARVGDVRFDVGVGSWGAAQRGARRIDVGPSLSATLPIAGQPVRLALDWRQRVAGNAAPGSGLVLTLGADF